MIIAGQELIWGAPERMMYAPLFIFAGVVVLLAAWYRERRVAGLMHPQHMKLLLSGYGRWRFRTKAMLLLGALGSIFLALLQPQWGHKESVVHQEGRDVLIALDISRSMHAQDVKPDRLSFMKMKIRKLLAQLSFDRVGLILFSGVSFLQCPLTADYKTFQMFLDHVTPEAISSGTTGIGSAIQKALEVFKRSQNRKNKLLLLITDGEDFASDMKGVVARIAQESLAVCAWGVGTEQGAPIPLYDRRGVMVGNQKDAAGNLAVTRLNPELLRSVSEQVGGYYQGVTSDDSDVQRISAYVGSLERGKLDEHRVAQYEDRYPWVLGVTLLCLVLEWLL